MYSVRHRAITESDSYYRVLYTQCLYTRGLIHITEADHYYYSYVSK